MIKNGCRVTAHPRKIFICEDAALPKIFLTGKISVKAYIEFHNPFSRALLVFRLPRVFKNFWKSKEINWRKVSLLKRFISATRTFGDLPRLFET